MKKRYILILAILLLVFNVIMPNFAMAVTDKDLEVDLPINSITFNVLYDNLCKNLGSDKAKYITGKKIETADVSRDNNGSNEVIYNWLVSNKKGCMQTVGYTKNSKTNTKNYVIYEIVCIHKHGELIKFTVFYNTEGQYIGNIKYDLTNGRATSSSRCPYYISTNGNITLE